MTRTTRLQACFGVMLILWSTHALAYLAHEYAHTFVAWCLGWKANPLALKYGSLGFDNLILQNEIDENVDYAPIFAAGRGLSADLIGVAGVLLGNGALYLCARWLLDRAEHLRQAKLATFAYFLCVMNVGNFISYVPMRSFATHADMATAARGFGVPAWLLTFLLGIPFGVAAWHLFTRLLPHHSRTMVQSAASRTALLLISAWIVFCFFGSAGRSNYGALSRWLSIASQYLLFPTVVALCWPTAEHATRKRDGGL